VRAMIKVQYTSTES